MTTPPPVPADDPMFALLERERAAFLAEVARVPLARQAERPAPDRWSVVEIVEHVARIDTGVAKLLAFRAAQPLPATPDELAGAQFTSDKVARVRDRAQRIEAPERVRPTGTLSPEVALEQLTAARAALTAAYRVADPAVLDGMVHPHLLPAIGPLTLRAWVELAAHHDARHAQQVGELAEEYGAAR